MYLNKGTYGHFGGILHAGIHGIATAFVLVTSGLPFVVCAIFDFVIHYHTDWVKVKLCKIFNLKPDNSEWYWHLLGLDQLIHALTCIGIVAWLIK
jgi:hypothetical protein